jgi:hypothetical protein
MKTPDPAADPEKLLEALELELARHRSARAVQKVNRNVFRIVSLAILLGGTVLAFALLEAMLSNFPRPPHAAAPTAVAGGK